VLPVGRGRIVARLRATAGGGLSMPTKADNGYIVQSDELLSAFLELEATLP